MDPAELYGKLQTLEELEKKIAGNGGATADNPDVREHSRLANSLPDLFSYDELRAYHHFLLHDGEYSAEKLTKDHQAEIERIRAAANEDIAAAETRGIDLKRRTLAALKGACSDSAYETIERKLDEVL